MVARNVASVAISVVVVVIAVLTTHGASWNHIFVSIVIGCMLNGI